MHWSPARFFIRFEINVYFYCTNRDVNDSTLHCNNKGFALNCFMYILFDTCSSHSYWCIGEHKLTPLPPSSLAFVWHSKYASCIRNNENIRAAISFYNEYFLAYALRGWDRWRIHYQHLTVIDHLNYTSVWILVCLRQLASWCVERILNTDIRYKNSRNSFFHQMFFLSPKIESSMT